MKNKNKRFFCQAQLNLITLQVKSNNHEKTMDGTFLHLFTYPLCIHRIDSCFIMAKCSFSLSLFSFSSTYTYTYIYLCITLNLSLSLSFSLTHSLSTYWREQSKAKTCKHFLFLRALHTRKHTVLLKAEKNNISSHFTSNL